MIDKNLQEVWKKFGPKLFQRPLMFTIFFGLVLLCIYKKYDTDMSVFIEIAKKHWWSFDIVAFIINYSIVIFPCIILLSVLDSLYKNSWRWCDVHPVLAAMLKLTDNLVGISVQTMYQIIRFAVLVFPIVASLAIISGNWELFCEHAFGTDWLSAIRMSMMLIVPACEFIEYMDNREPKHVCKNIKKPTAYMPKKIG